MKNCKAVLCCIHETFAVDNTIYLTLCLTFFHDKVMAIHMSCSFGSHGPVFQRARWYCSNILLVAPTSKFPCTRHGLCCANAVLLPPSLGISKSRLLLLNDGYSQRQHLRASGGLRGCFSIRRESWNTSGDLLLGAFEGAQGQSSARRQGPSKTTGCLLCCSFQIDDTGSCFCELSWHCCARKTKACLPLCR